MYQAQITRALAVTEQAESFQSGGESHGHGHPHIMGRSASAEKRPWDSGWSGVRLEVELSAPVGISGEEPRVP